MDAKLKFIPAAIGGTYANFVVVGLGIVGLLTEFDLKSLAVLIFWLAVFVTIFVSLKKKYDCIYFIINSFNNSIPGLETCCAALE